MLQSVEEGRKRRGGLDKAPDLASLMTWPRLSARTVPVEGGQVRLRLETAVWEGLDSIARQEGKPTRQLCAELDAARRKDVALTSTIRTFVLDYFRRMDPG